MGTTGMALILACCAGRAPDFEIHLPKPEIFTTHCEDAKSSSYLGNHCNTFPGSFFKGTSKIKRRKEILLLKGTVNVCLICQPLYFNEVCFTSSGICFVTRRQPPSVSIKRRLFSVSSWRLRGLRRSRGRRAAGARGETQRGLVPCLTGQAKPLPSSHKGFESCSSDALGESHTPIPEVGTQLPSFIYGDIKYATIIPQHQSNKHHFSI